MSALQVAGVVAFYMCSALVVCLRLLSINKAILISAPGLPLTLLFIQLIIAVILLKLSALFSRGVIEIPDSIFVNIVGLLLFLLHALILMWVLSLVFNTLCLRGVDASFFQVLPLTIIVSSVHTRAMPSSNVILASVVVTGGFFLGVAPSSKVPLIAAPSLLSLAYGFLSSLFIAFHAVLIKMSLPYCNNSSIQLAWWTNAGSAVMLLPFVVLCGELSILRDMMADPHWDATVFLWGTLVTGFFGFLLCIVLAARSVLQTVIGVTYFGDLITTKTATGPLLFIVILGGTMSVFLRLDSGFYTWIKAVETPPPPRNATDIEKSGEKVEDMQDDIVFQAPEERE
ncbi:hypothetical protein B0H14DRAFT_2870769 [Mycena olivaceomarginata]|nr:hypothetical protein B0H14DRAFT_2870769 [Mycena olivaceomarginata]